MTFARSSRVPSSRRQLQKSLMWYVIYLLCVSKNFLRYNLKPKINPFLTSTGSLNKFCKGVQNLLAHPVFGISIILEDKSMPKGQFPSILMVRNDLAKEAQIFTMVAVCFGGSRWRQESLCTNPKITFGWRVVLDCVHQQHTHRQSSMHLKRMSNSHYLNFRYAISSKK